MCNSTIRRFVSTRPASNEPARTRWRRIARPGRVCYGLSVLCAVQQRRAVAPVHSRSHQGSRLSRWLAGLLGVGVLLAAGPAWAYVPPADFLLRLLAERRHKQDVRDITAHLTAELAPEQASVQERIYIDGPAKMRLVQQKPGADHIRVVREAAQAAGPQDALEPQPKAPPALLPMLLVPPRGSLDGVQARMVAALRDAGIDTSIVSLGRFERRIAYIIGARVWETEQPQLWLYKGTRLPMRIVVYDDRTRPATRVETRLLEWGQAVNGNWFPGIIEVWHDDTLVRRATTTKVQLNQGLPETLFELP